MQFELVSTGEPQTYLIFVPIGEDAKILAGTIRRNVDDTWTIYAVSDRPMSTATDGITILAAYVDDFVKGCPFTSVEHLATQTPSREE